ncbi:GNAT family N-acetyltransferase [Actinotalea sp. K2]|uniref:GNAT family N-acetyltransferase n=1 Tax=Actinotalea sp. K2 TaxID=2939438 RepID=UPI002017533B|nr:GNAT family N-acetyltransferase [Actinotalea sp. K2]MCL3861009.1 GNAT family N-acetyltransferase [Actinotalea sp. K2]
MSAEVASGVDPLVCARLLAAAFADEPGIGWVCGPRARARQAWFAATLRTHETLPGATRYVVHVAGDPAGAAVVTPAGSRPGTLAQLAWTARVALDCGPTAIRRTLRYLGASAAPDDALTLEFVGVLPAQRGRGVGGALLKQVIADAAGRPVYLTTADPANVGLYERFGWRETGRAGVGGLVVAAMLRSGVGG